MATSLLNGADVALRVLSNVETLPSHATGALVFGGDGVISGVVLLQDGRVCWAAAAGLRKRLSDLLRSSALRALSVEDVEQLFHQCKAEKKPLGEAFLERGWLSAASLRSALLHHTAESLTTAPSWMSRPRWVPHRTQGYSSSFTFMPVELLAFASAVSRGETFVNLAHERLRQLAGERNSAVFDGAGEVLLACQLPEDSEKCLSELRAASAWAAMSLGETSPCASAIKFAGDGRGGTWLGWRDEQRRYLVHCKDREEFSLVVRGLNRHGWTSVVQSSVAMPPTGPELQTSAEAVHSINSLHPPHR